MLYINMKRFREFIRSQPFVCQLREEEAAPTASPESPKDPEQSKTNKFHFDYLQQELGIGDEEFKSALEGGIQTLYKVPEYGWGFRVQPPVQATIIDKGNDQYQVTFMLKQKKLTNPKSFVLPYSQGQRPTYFEGDIEDKTVMMNKEELADLIVPPYEAAASGMGGMPPAGGGMPPGAPPGGMAGAPPPLPGGPMGAM